MYRDYLPYKSAREYQDRQMAKWMGFFLSEHTTALSTYGDTIDFSQSLGRDEKLLLLSQLYLGKMSAFFYTCRQKQPYLGKIIELAHPYLFVRDRTEGTLQLHIDEILKLALAEVLDNE